MRTSAGDMEFDVINGHKNRGKMMLIQVVVNASELFYIFQLCNRLLLLG